MFLLFIITYFKIYEIKLIKIKVKNLLNQNQREVFLLKPGFKLRLKDHDQHQLILIVWDNNSKLFKLKVEMNFSVDFLLDRLQTHHRMQVGQDL